MFEIIVADSGAVKCGGSHGRRHGRQCRGPFEVGLVNL